MTPEKQLAGFLARYEPALVAQARAARATMRKRLPGALELVYDNYNALVIGYGPTERASEAIFSIAIYPRWINLFFLSGARLADPDGRLQGSGNQVRSIRLASAKTLDEPAVKKLMAAAIAMAPRPFDPAQSHRLVIRSISAKQRARRPSKASDQR